MALDSASALADGQVLSGRCRGSCLIISSSDENAAKMCIAPIVIDPGKREEARCATTSVCWTSEHFLSLDCNARHCRASPRMFGASQAIGLTRPAAVSWQEPARAHCQLLTFTSALKGPNSLHQGCGATKVRFGLLLSTCHSAWACDFTGLNEAPSMHPICGQLPKPPQRDVPS